MIAVIVFLLFVQAPTPVPRDVSLQSTITTTGQESFAELLAKFNQTGNVVTDGRDQFKQNATSKVKLPPGKYSFWQALDRLSAAAELEFTTTTEGVRLRTRSLTAKPLMAYDGPWRARLVRRTVIAYENPALDRLLVQVELTLEPRMVPILATLGAKSVEARSKAPHTEALATEGNGVKYPFEGEPSKLIEVRLLRPPRNLAALERFELTGDIWLAPGRLMMSVPLRSQASTELEGCRFSINQLFHDASTMTLSTELLYPAGSFDWESHQASLLQSMKLTLRQGSTEHQPRQREINTDAGRRTTARWQFPKVTGDWQAHLNAPSTPVKLPVKFIFENVELP